MGSAAPRIHLGGAVSQTPRISHRGGSGGRGGGGSGGYLVGGEDGAVWLGMERQGSLTSLTSGLRVKQLERMCRLADALVCDGGNPTLLLSNLRIAACFAS